mgnify:CR=1 FL=1|jgi:hypothetical protein
MVIGENSTDVKQTTAKVSAMLMAKGPASAKSKFLSLCQTPNNPAPDARRRGSTTSSLLRLTLDPTLPF